MGGRVGNGGIGGRGNKAEREGKRHGGGGGRGGETKENVSGLCRRGNWKASVRPAETARRERDPPVRAVQQYCEGLEG